MPRRARMYIAFAAMAVLAGPAKFLLGQKIFAAMQGLPTAGSALSGLFAGVVLAGSALTRRQSTLRPAERLAVVVLLLPQLLNHLINTGLNSVSWLRPSPGGDLLLLTLAAPLWFALLAALQFTGESVSRTVTGAGIAAIGAACLTLPTGTYGVATNQLVALLSQICILVLTVWTWSFARERMISSSAALAAGAFLLLQTALFQVPLLLARRSELQQIPWHDAALPMLLQALASAVATFLWFWLLTHMSGSAFTLHPLAAWVASGLAALALFGVSDWREDAAASVGFVALIIGLHARSVDEQPIALELS